MAPEQTLFINHPYYPRDVDIPRYRPNNTPLLSMLGSFMLIISITLYASSKVANWWNPRLTRRDLFFFLWFVLCGFLHCFFEGYYVLNHANLSSSQSLFSQLWKEYALSDSRYLTSDSFMLCVETFTAVVWGPLCWAIAWMIVRGAFVRHLAQIVLCVGHLYSVTLYYGTSYFDHKTRGISHCRPEFQYYWVYYIGCNLPWVVVPSYILAHSWIATSQIFKVSKLSRE